MMSVNSRERKPRHQSSFGSAADGGVARGAVIGGRDVERRLRQGAGEEAAPEGQSQRCLQHDRYQPRAALGQRTQGLRPVTHTDYFQ